MNISRFQNSAAPDHENAEACFNEGINAMQNGDYLQAETFFRQTLALAPDSIETRLNLGYTLDMLNRPSEALACYEGVLSTAPHNPKARYNRAIHLLRKGKLAAGFADYEPRFTAIKNTDNRIYKQPRWDGSPLNGSNILVYCEQGLGDAIQFCRYIPEVLKMGGRVTLEVQPPLFSLLATIPGLEKIVLKSDTPPPTDCHVPLLSLPRILGTDLDTIPAPIPYLLADPLRTSLWQKRV